MLMLINIFTNCAAYPKISRSLDSASLNLNSSPSFSCCCHHHGIPSYHQLMVKISKVPMHCKSQNSSSSPAAFNFQKNVHYSKSRPNKSSTECMYCHKKGH